MEIFVIVTPNFNLATTTGFIDPFRAANYLDGQQHFKWHFFSQDGGRCLASNNILVDTKPLQEAGQIVPDIIVISSSWSPEEFSSTSLIASVRKYARYGIPIVGIDTGAFIMAKAGLLDGKKATIHYEHTDTMLELFPETETTEDLFVFDGNCITCCGGLAVSDCALHIIVSTKGAKLANAAARYIFHPGLRPQNSHQIPTSTEPLGISPPDSVRRAIKIMEEHLEEPIKISEICKRINLSQRQLNRLFSKFIAKTPAIYYRDVRLDRARGLVTQTDMQLSEVAIASGFASQVHFSRAYRLRFGLPPGVDRKQGRIPFEFRAWPLHRINASKSNKK